MDTAILEEIGLTRGEIKVYIAALRLGSASTGPIAQESGISRSKLYGILDNLEKKGLMSHVERNGVRTFQAVEPSKVTDVIADKQKRFERLKADFEHFIPELEAIQKGSGRLQKVLAYQGLKGLMTAHEHVYQKLHRGDEYVYLGVPKFQPQEHHLYWQRDHLRRAKAGIRTRILFNRDTDPSVLKNRNSYKGCQARYMPRGVKTPAYFLVYKDTVMIAIASSNPLAIEIISQEIADSFMSYFEAFWKVTVPFSEGNAGAQRG